MKNMTQLKRIFGTILIGMLLVSCNGRAAADPAATQTPAPATRLTVSSVVEGHIVPSQYTSLFFFSAGTVSEVWVKQGSEVKKGDVLARLGDRESFQAAVTAAQLELASAQRQVDDLQAKAALVSGQAQADLATSQRDYVNAAQKLADLDTDAYQTKQDNANTDVNKAKDDLKTAQDDFDKVKNLGTDNTVRKNANTKFKDAQKKYDNLVRTRDLLVNNLETARAQVALTKARWDDALKTRDDTQQGVNTKDLTLANARLTSANAQVSAAQAAIKHLDLVAPYDSKVVKVDLNPGEQTTPSTTVIEVADLSAWYVETSDLTEMDVVAITQGQKASLIPDALPDLNLNGTVESIGDTDVEKSGYIDYMVRIRLDKTDPALRWGMTVKVTFIKK